MKLVANFLKITREKSEKLLKTKMHGNFVQILNIGLFIFGKAYLRNMIILTQNFGDLL